MKKILAWPLRHVYRHLGNINPDSPDGKTILSQSGATQDLIRVLLLMIVLGIADNAVYDVFWLGLSPIFWIVLLTGPVSAALLTPFVMNLQNEPKRFLTGQIWMPLPYLLFLFPWVWVYHYFTEGK